MMPLGKLQVLNERLQYPVCSATRIKVYSLLRVSVKNLARIRQESGETPARLRRDSSENPARIWRESGENIVWIRWESSKNPARKTRWEPGKNPAKIQLESGKNQMRIYWESGENQVSESFLSTSYQSQRKKLSLKKGTTIFNVQVEMHYWFLFNTHERMTPSTNIFHCASSIMSGSYMLLIQ